MRPNKMIAADFERHAFSGGEPVLTWRKAFGGFQCGRPTPDDGYSNTRERTANVPLRKGYTQVCVWEGTTCSQEEVDDFVAFMREELGARVQYLEEITTGPGKGGPGGRIDLFFAVHDDDASGPFAIKRLAYGIRWLDDAISEVNGGAVLYPRRVLDYRCWTRNLEEE